MTLPSTAPAAELRRLCGGAVHLPGDPGYDSARRSWNAAVEHCPVAVVYPAFPDEVAEVLRTAAAAGLQVAPQGTGHGAAPLSGRLDAAVLLRTSAMTELRIDPHHRTARVGAGVLWGEAVDAAGEHGLAARHPSSPDVGVVGYSLGGGISWYARAHGLQSCAVTALEIVLADGSFVRTSADVEPELFWALRGGGCGLGVVTTVEFELLPVADVVAGLLAWDWTEAERVLTAWAGWCHQAPDDVTTSFRIVQAPDLPELPAQVRGRRLAVVDGAVLGADERAGHVLAALRAVGPELDTFARVPAASLSRLHLEPEGPTAGYARSALLGSMPAQAIDAMLTAAGPDAHSSLMVAELRQLGGALGRPDPRGGVLDCVDGAFLALAIGIGGDEAGRRRMVDDADRLLTGLAPWANGGHYLPMLDDQADARSGFSPAVYRRLAAVRHAVDPAGLFLAQHDASAG